MKKNKIIGYSFIVLLISGILLYKFNPFAQELTIEQRSIEKNIATSVKLNAGTHNIKQTKFTPGFYDVYSDRQMILLGTTVDNNNPLLGTYFTLNNSIEIIGDGTVTFIPSEFNQLEFSKQGIATIKNDYSAVVGNEIEAGTYNLWTLKESAKISVYEGLQDEYLRSGELFAEKDNPYSLTLNTGEYIDINIKNPLKNDVYIQKAMINEN